MNCMLDISQTLDILIITQNMEKRFTYSPAFVPTENTTPNFISFQEFQKNSSGKAYSPSYQPTNYQPQTQPTFVNAYTSNIPFARQITFGHDQSLTQQSSIQPVRITFNNNEAGMFASQPIYNSQKMLGSIKPEPPAIIAQPQNNTASEKQLIPANSFAIDTSEFKNVKEDEFTGCFHCFSPVTYNTKIKKGLCS